MPWVYPISNNRRFTNHHYDNLLPTVTGNGIHPTDARFLMQCNICTDMHATCMALQARHSFCPPPSPACLASVPVLRVVQLGFLQQRRVYVDNYGA